MKREFLHILMKKYSKSHICKEKHNGQLEESRKPQREMKFSF